MICFCLLCRETRRLLERLVYISSQDFPVTVVQVASWYLLRHLHAKNDHELMNVSIWQIMKCTGVIYLFIYCFERIYFMFSCRFLCNMQKRLEMKGCLSSILCLSLLNREYFCTPRHEIMHSCGVFHRNYCILGKNIN